MLAVLTDKSKWESIRGYFVAGRKRDKLHWYLKSFKVKAFLDKAFSGPTKCEVVKVNHRGLWVRLPDDNVIYRKRNQVIMEKRDGV